MGMLYKGTAALGLVAAGVLTQAMAGGEPAEAAPAPVAATSEAEAVEACRVAASEKMAGRVAEAAVTRVWRGSEGYIVSLTLVNEAGGRRDYTCREGAYGLQVARG